MEITHSFVGMNELKKELTTNIYPNPSTGLINIETKGYSRLSIFKMDGRLIETESEFVNNTTKFLPKGIYLFKITHDNDSQEIKRIIIQ